MLCTKNFLKELPKVQLYRKSVDGVNLKELQDVSMVKCIKLRGNRPEFFMTPWRIQKKIFTFTRFNFVNIKFCKNFSTFLFAVEGRCPFSPGWGEVSLFSGLRGGVPFLRVYKRWFISIWCHLTQRSENRLGVRRKELRDNNNLRDRNLRSQAEIFTEFQYNLRNWPCFCKVGRFLHLMFRKNYIFILDISKFLT